LLIWFGIGGTAFNGVVEELKKLTTRVAHVLPVSDDGGSTAEIVRVLGKLLQVFNAVVQNYPSRPYLAYNVNYDSTMSMDM